MKIPIALMRIGFTLAILPTLLLISGSTSCIFACAGVQIKGGTAKKAETVALQSALDLISAPLDTTFPAKTMRDPRDGAVYTTVTIGRQTWMAENLRYNAPGSMLNPYNPSKTYGRLYELVSAQTACPVGWHLPSDAEWDTLEMAHGMPWTFIGEGGWRGEHGTNMKADAGWEKDGNGTNSLGFNVLPAGFYFSGKMGGAVGMQGLGYSAAYWSSVEENVAWARFLFGSRKWVNKWGDENNETGVALACRCVRD